MNVETIQTIGAILLQFGAIVASTLLRLRGDIDTDVWVGIVGPIAAYSAAMRAHTTGVKTGAALSMRPPPTGYGGSV